MATKLSFPRTHTNADVRSREYLTPSEVEKLRKAARRMGRHGVRNDAMILLVYRYGLRVGDLMHLRWDQVDLQTGFLHVRRLKKGLPSTHPFTGAEIRALRQIHRVADDAPYVFLSERGGPMTVNNAQKMIQKVGEVASVLQTLASQLSHFLNLVHPNVDRTCRGLERLQADLCRSPGGVSTGPDALPDALLC